MPAVTAPRVGVIFKSYEKLSSIMAYAQRAGELELEGGFWISEAHQWLRSNGGDARGAVTTIAAAAMAAKRVPVGLAMASPYLRHPAILAAEAAALDELSGGRFLLGLGASKVTTSFFELDVNKKPPLKVHREAFAILRQALSGESFQFIGEVFAAAMPRIAPEELGHRGEIPIYLSATGAKMQSLAGEVADGVLLPSLTSPGFASLAIDNTLLGLKKAGRRPNTFDIGATVLCCIAEDGTKALNVIRSHVADLVSHKIRNGQGDEVLSSASLGADLNTLRGRVLAGHQDMSALITDDMMRKLGVVAGTPDEAATILQQLINAGVNLPLMEIVGANDAAILQGMTHLARDVIPRLKHGPNRLHAQRRS